MKQNIEQLIHQLEDARESVKSPSEAEELQQKINELWEWHHQYTNKYNGGPNNGQEQMGTAETGQLQIPPNFPFLIMASGRYRYQPKFSFPKTKGETFIERAMQEKEDEDRQIEFAPELIMPHDSESPDLLLNLPFPWFRYREDILLDVDGQYPQMTVSGTIDSSHQNVHWIANMKRIGQDLYSGKIWYKKGDVNSFKYTWIEVSVNKSLFAGQQYAIVKMGGIGLRTRTIKVDYVSKRFRQVEFEFDREQGITPSLSINTHAHPNRPVSLPAEILTVDKVFERSGFEVKRTAGDNTLPPALKGANGTWSDAEMHDAMQTYWSKFTNAPQWSLWTLFAQQHDDGHGLGGIMFDDIGPQHRQGTAIFHDSFISDWVLDSINEEAEVARMRFWTTVHEMGHAFNLAHSWQKDINFGSRWHPRSQNEPSALSFMNYPYFYGLGYQDYDGIDQLYDFFMNFEYRFSDQELLFMRHAPSEFVQMGNADWFENHNLKNLSVSRLQPLDLIIRTHKKTEEYEFMEPVNLELKLTNTARGPESVDANLLKYDDAVSIVVKRDNGKVKQFHSFRHALYMPENKVLMPGDSIYESKQISTSSGKWLIDEPGYYTIQACLRRGEDDIVSNVMRIRVKPPKNYEQAYVAQDYFDKDVAKVLTVQGSKVLDKANDTLREVVEKFPETNAAIHAATALANPMTKDYNLLDFSVKDHRHLQSVAEAGGKVKVKQADPAEANKLVEKIMIKNAKEGKEVTERVDEVVDTIGHIPARKVVENFAESFKKEGKKKEAKQLQNALYKVYKSRGVIDSVVDEVKGKADDL